MKLLLHHNKECVQQCRKVANLLSQKHNGTRRHFPVAFDVVQGVQSAGWEKIWHSEEFTSF